MTDTRPPLFECEIPLRWHDYDANNHINNVNYFVYFEEARHQFFTRVHPRTPETEHIMPVVVEASCTFLKPLFYPGTVIIRVYPASMGNSSFGLTYEVINQQTQALHATASSKIVCLDRQSHKAIKVPDFIRDKF